MRSYLILDDNLPYAENLAEIVSDHGDRVRFTDRGEEALSWVSEERFDAVLTDMRMPQMSGAQFLHRIRAVDPDLPAIALTAYSRDRELEQAREEGLLGVFSKPAPITQLLALLGRARRGGLVALVEDDPSLADNLTETFSLAGFSTVTARSVMQTERLFHLRPFAAVVDMRVPGGPDGEAMKKLATRFPGLPMVAITGHSVEPPLVPAQLLHKPFSSDALLQTLELLHRESR